MRHAHRTARPALLVSAALLLSACGIPTTGVVESGAPGTGVEPRMLLYFIRNGSPVSVSRGSGREEDVVTTVRLLFRGPNRQEQRAGLTSELPLLKRSPKIWNKGTEVRVRMPDGTRTLTRPALEQLICTVVHARPNADPGIRSVQVAVEYQGSAARPVDGAGVGCPRATSAEAVTPRDDSP